MDKLLKPKDRTGLKKLKVKIDKNSGNVGTSKRGCIKRSSEPFGKINKALENLQK